MVIRKLSCSLILFLFFLSYVKSEESNDESLWRTLTNGVYSVLPWNWYGSSSIDAELEYVKPEFKNTKEQSSSETIPVILFDDENDKAYNDEKSETISFTEFMEKLDSEIVSAGVTNSGKISSIFKSVMDAFSNNKLFTNVVLGGKNFLVNLGMLDSDERTKTFGLCNHGQQLWWSWLIQIIYSLLYWLPGMHTMQTQINGGPFQGILNGRMSVPGVANTISTAPGMANLMTSVPGVATLGTIPRVNSFVPAPSIINHVTSVPAVVDSTLSSPQYLIPPTSHVDIQEKFLKNPEESYIILTRFQDLLNTVVTRLRDTGELDANTEADIRRLNNLLTLILPNLRSNFIVEERLPDYRNRLNEILDLMVKMSNNSKIRSVMPIRLIQTT